MSSLTGLASANIIHTDWTWILAHPLFRLLDTSATHTHRQMGTHIDFYRFLCVSCHCDVMWHAVQYYEFFIVPLVSVFTTVLTRPPFPSVHFVIILPARVFTYFFSFFPLFIFFKHRGMSNTCVITQFPPLQFQSDTPDRLQKNNVSLLLVCLGGVWLFFNLWKLLMIVSLVKIYGNVIAVARVAQFWECSRWKRSLGVIGNFYKYYIILIYM